MILKSTDCGAKKFLELCQDFNVGDAKESSVPAQKITAAYGATRAGTDAPISSATVYLAECHATAPADIMKQNAPSPT